jgi:hypothetical protein
MSSNVLNVDFKAGSKKPTTWANPEIKGELPTDFPCLQYTHKKSELKDELTSALKRFGIDRIEDAGTIHIAFPQKHPDLHYGHNNSGGHAAVAELRDSLMKAFPEGKFSAAREICETVKLDRSDDQGVTHALSAKQVYDIHLPDGKEVPAYLGDSADKKFFIVTDHVAEQGTTLTNLMSYIRYNGGHVLFAAVGKCVRTDELVQDRTRDTKNLSAPFNNAARNTGRLEEIAQHFADCEKVAGRKTSPQECMLAFERALNDCGNTVFALTDVECESVADKPFGELMTELRAVSPRKVNQACTA